MTKTFTSQDPALTINYIGFVYRKLIEQGYVSKTLLKNTNLTEDDLFNPDYRCTFEQHKVFVLNALALSKDPHLGPRMALSFNPINIGLPASAAISSDKFSTAIDVFKQYASLNFSIISFDYFYNENELIIEWQPAVDISDVEYFVAGSSMVVSENLWKLLLGKSEKITSYVELTLSEPVGWKEFTKAIPFDVYFDKPFNRSVIPANLMELKLSGHDPVLHEHMLRLCKKQKADTFFDKGLEARLCELITQNNYLTLSVEQAAVQLGMSERSLRRQLNQAGTNYKKIVDTLREARAKELLVISAFPVSTIAYDLGFSDPSNFSRSFKRWTGGSPQEFRQKSKI